MANYYTQASFIIPLKNEQLDIAHAVATCFEDEKIDLTKPHKTKAAQSYDNAVYRLAKKMVRHVQDYDASYPMIGFCFEKDDEGLLITHDENINTENAANFTRLLLRHFDIDGYVAIEASHTCDRPRPGAFGGHAAFVTKKGVRWVSTHNWIEQQARRSGLVPTA